MGRAVPWIFPLILGGTACGALASMQAATPFVSAGPGGGGALAMPAISPHDPNFIVVASPFGAVWRSADGGASWTVLDKRALRDASASPVVWHPAYGGWMYACGGGILKMSKDAGATWKPLCMNQPWGGEPLSAFAVDGENAKVMFAGTVFGAFRSLDGGKSWSACHGVRGRVLGIAIDPTTPPQSRIVVAGTTEGVFRSANSGSIWHDSSAGLPYRGLAHFCGAGTKEAGRFACYAVLPSRTVQGRFEGGVWRSLDHGATWQTAMGTGINTATARADAWGAGDLPRYGPIAVPRAAPNTVWVAAAGTGYWPPNHTTIYRTDDGGANWRAVAFGDPRGEASGIAANIVPGWLAADHVWGWWNGAGGGLAADDRYPDHAVFTNAGELYQTRDGGKTWTQGYGRRVEATPGVPADAGTPALWKEGARWGSAGLEASTVWQVACDAARPGRMLACTSRAGIVTSEDGGATWRWIPSFRWGTVYQLAFDPGVPELGWAAGADQDDIPHSSSLDGPRGGGGVAVTRDAGLTWTPSGRGLPDAPVTSVAVDPRSPKSGRVVYAAVFGHGVWRSGDGGRNWAAAAGQPGIGGNRHAYRIVVGNDGAVHCTVTGRRSGGAFPEPGGLWRSRDGGATWTELTASIRPPWPGDAVVDPRDPGVIWLATASVPGRNDGGVWRTVDGGAAWKKVLGEERLPQEIAPSAVALFLAMDPASPDTVYAGIPSHGLFVTRDSGRTWTEVRGIPVAECQRASIDPANPGALWVGTRGAGMWKGPAR